MEHIPLSHKLIFLGIIIIWSFTSFNLAQPRDIKEDRHTPYVLIEEYTYNGTVERTARLLYFQYTAGYMLLQITDDTSDGIFRSSFEP